MSKEPNNYSIVYNSNLTMESPSELATLCIFYDQVFLPCGERGGIFNAINLPKKKQESLNLSLLEDSYKDRSSEDDIPNWDSKHQLLFEQGVIQRLPKPEINAIAWDEAPAEALNLVIKTGFIFVNKQDNGVYVKEALMNHLRRTDIQLPGIFVTNSKSSRRRS